jgi:hypothetical protein
VLVEIIGEPESGKSHLSLLFPRPFLLDTTVKQEALPIIRKLHTDWEKRYKPVRSWEDLEKEVESAVAREDVATIVFDTSMDLQDLAAIHWLKEKKKESVFPITQYKHVRDKIDVIINQVQKAEKNMVVTAGMKDEYIQDKKTGKRIRDGYARMPQQADIRLYLRIAEKTKVSESGIAVTEYVRECVVVKNRFRDKAGKDWIPNLNPVDWKTLMQATGLSEEEWVT